MENFAFTCWKNDMNEFKIASIHDYMYLYKINGTNNFKPYPITLDCIVITLCIRGSIGGKIDMIDMKLTPSDLIVMLPGQIIGYGKPSEDFCAIVGIFTKTFAEEIHLPDYTPSALTVMSVNTSKKVDDRDLDVIKLYIKTISDLTSKEDHPNVLQIVRHLTISLFYYIVRDLKQTKDKKQGNMTRTHILVQAFLDNLQKYHKQERSVEFYAKQISVSPKHLSQTLKKATKRSASEWIDSFVILEAKAMLKNTDKTIQQISYELHFPNQSFFGKYFKRLESMSPKAYRDS